MKKTLLHLIAILFTSFGFTQITVANNNHVGIGTDKDYVPSATLEVSSENNGDAILRIESDKDNNNEADNARIELRQDKGSVGIDIGFNNEGEGLESDNLFRITGRYSDEDKGDLLTIRLNSKNIGIGTSDPISALHINQFATDKGLYITEPNNSQTISLHLANNASGEYGFLALGGDTRLRGNGQTSVFDGKVYAKSFLATETNTPYADYVFEKYYIGESELNPQYTMPTLEEVESFTKKHHHLPDIPSYKEVKEKGIDLGEMSNLLLQKIEELTLYTIEQNKLNQKQQEKIQQLELKIQQLEEMTNKP